MNLRLEARGLEARSTRLEGSRLEGSRLEGSEIRNTHYFVTPTNMYEKRKHALVSGVSDPQHIDVKEKLR